MYTPLQFSFATSMTGMNGSYLVGTTKTSKFLIIELKAFLYPIFTVFNFFKKILGFLDMISLSRFALRQD